MLFRTEIEPPKASFTLGHDDRIVMLGSCFTDSIGSILSQAGFNVTHNPAGALYNPASVARVIEKDSPYTAADLFRDNAGVFHCLDYAARFSGDNADSLLDVVNNVRDGIADALADATAAIITFGTARVYDFLSGGYVAGNCHRLPSALFSERLLETGEITDRWLPLLEKLPPKVIFTLSPIRYTARGLVENSLSKATLRLAIDRLCRAGADYFPAFEILNDDLRDYRFYADDLKHPSEMAVEYIYDIFSKTYFTDPARERAARSRKEARRRCHIPDFHRQ